MDMTNMQLIAIAAAAAIIAGPVLLGLAGLVRARGAAADARAGAGPRSGWRLAAASALVYTLAFNLTFFIQELFLVLPKALTPGLRPTLFHNNHGWDGEHPLASLFQGTGALATLVIGLACAWLLQRGRGGSATGRLFLLWMAYCGVFMALPQVVIGALSPHSDVGMAMAYLDLGSAARTVAALLALAAIPLLALWLTRPLLALASDVRDVATAGARTGFVFRVATLPTLIALPLIVAFRVPREWIEVLLLPLLVTVIGTVWMQAGAWRVRDALPAGGTGRLPVAWLIGAVVLLLLVFQFVLRPGIAFY